MKFFQNVKYEKGKPGMSKIMWAPIDAIATFPTLPLEGSGVAAGDTVIAVGDFVFKNPLEGFLDLFNDLYKGSELDWKSEGDISAPGLMAQAKGRVNGMSASLLEFYRDVLGVPGVTLIKNSDCKLNEWWVIGCDCSPAQFIIDGKSGGKGGSEAKAINFEIKSQQEPYKYTGAIQSVSLINSFITINIIP